MATGGKHMCDLCEVQHLTSEAEIWCSECEESLCTNCKVQHGISRLTKKHMTIAIDDYKKLPFSVQNVKIYCEEHNERFEYFCSSHDTPCCVKCLTLTHRNCNESMTPLREVIEKSKTSKLTLDLEKFIKDLKINLQKVLNVQEKNLQSMHQQKDKCQVEIKKYRREINERLDQMEKDLLDELSMACTKYSSEAENLISILQNRMATIELLEHDLFAIKQHATDLQTYICVRVMAKESNDQESYLQSIIDTRKIISAELRFIRQTPNLLGNLVIHNQEEDVLIVKERDHEAQILAARQCREFENIRMNKKISFSISQQTNHSTIVDCLITNDRSILFASLQDKLLILFNSDGIFKQYIELLHLPLNIIQLNNQIFVTYREKRFLNYFSVQNMKAMDTILLGGIPVTSAICGENILIGYEGTGFDIVDKAGKLISKTKAAFFVHPCFTTVKNNIIYCTLWKQNKVICIDMEGNKLSEISNKKLRAPIGITSDSHGNMLVTGYHSLNVLLFSKDGKNSREIIPSSDQRLKLRSIYYHQVLKLLLITTETGEAELYEEI